MKSTEQVLQSRGMTNEEAIKKYSHYTKSKLLNLILSKVAEERTIASRLLVNYKTSDVLDVLIKAFCKEKKLYTKIALSESIATFGREASEKLVPLLGTIGNNQHKVLPEKVFKKKNYPLPRDIVARTLIRIGIEALGPLESCLNLNQNHQILEAIDAIGFISYYEKDDTLLDSLLLLQSRSEDSLILWKIIRALQAFKTEEVIKILEDYLESDIEAFRFEAKRSLEQLNAR